MQSHEGLCCSRLPAPADRLCANIAIELDGKIRPVQSPYRLTESGTYGSGRQNLDFGHGSRAAIRKSIGLLDRSPGSRMEGRRLGRMFDSTAGWNAFSFRLVYLPECAITVP